MAKIVLDPGHGGSDAGSAYNGRREKDDVLKLALEVGKRLESKGQNISYTRVNDSAYTPFERAMMANTAAADFFLSLHRNSVRNPNTVNGAEAYVYSDSGIRGGGCREASGKSGSSRISEQGNIGTSESGGT